MSIVTARIDDLAWAAGLFEGEGSIDPAKPGRSPKICVVSTDKDVIYRFFGIIGLGSVRGPIFPKSSLGKKGQYWWTAGGSESVQAVLAVFWRYLGERRQSRAADAIIKASTMKPGSKYRKLKDKCNDGHSMADAYVYPSGRRACSTCRKAYGAAYFQRNKHKWR